MRVLITNYALESRAGTELYTRDLAHGLIKRGHLPVVYSDRLGDFANDLRASGVRVVNELEDLDQPPDIIHAHHHLPAMVALMRFSRVPAIFVCHGPDVWLEEAPLFPRILRYVAVDHACKARLFRGGIPENLIRVILNFVDLDRFKPRPPLPARPQRALIFSNQAYEGTQLPAIRSACRRAGIDVEVAGLAAGRVADAPETLLANYDLVFAKARAAIEAMAVGAAVVLCDAAGAGPMVSSSNFDELRAFNFGIRCLTVPVQSSFIEKEVARYDPIDAAEVCRRMRANGGAEAAIDQLIDLYKDVIDEYAGSPAPDITAEQFAVAEYLRALGPTISAFEEQAKELQTIRGARTWALFTKYVKMKQGLLKLSKLGTEK